MSGHLQYLSRILSPIVRRVRLLLARGVVRLVDDSELIQELQVGLLKNETRTVQRFQDYGIASHPIIGSELVAVFIGGNRDNGICVAVDDRRHRTKNLQPGEVSVYNDKNCTIYLKENGEIHIQAPSRARVNSSEVVVDASASVEINSPEVVISAATKVKINSPVVELPSMAATAANITISSPTSITGETAIIGDVEIEGNLTVTNGRITGQGTITP